MPHSMVGETLLAQWVSLSVCLATTFTFNFLTYLFMYNFLKLHLFLDTKIHQSTFNKYTNKLHLLEFLFLEEKSWEQVKVR